MSFVFRVFIIKYAYFVNFIKFEQSVKLLKPSEKVVFLHENESVTDENKIKRALTMTNPCRNSSSTT